MCDFCEALSTHKLANGLCSDKEFEHRITIAIVNGLYRKRRKTIQSRSIDFNNKGRGFELNYCPSCGRELRGEE